MQMTSTFSVNRSRTRWLLAFVVAFVALSTGVYFAWKAAERSETGARSQQGATQPALDQVTVRNAQGRYEFDSPANWTVVKKGSVTEVTSPRDEVLVSFGLAPRGDLLVASDRFLELLSDSFADLQLSGRQLGSTGGHLSMVRTGNAVEENGEELRFSAVVLEGDPENIAIAVFAKTFSQSNLSSKTNEIVASIRLLSD